MKIKYFSGEIDVKNSEVLADYLTDELGYANDPVVQAYADLLFRINEKIEYFESIEKVNESEYTNAQIKLLKSLLNGDVGQ